MFVTCESCDNVLIIIAYILFLFVYLCHNAIFLLAIPFKIEEQQKKALEDDPTVFDYDGVYDKMKANVMRPIAQDREERKV